MNETGATSAAVNAGTDPMLRVRNLHAAYAESKVLHGMAFEVHKGEVVTLLGRNGVGKTTTLKALIGLGVHRSGSVMFEGKELITLASNEIAKVGIAYCPEERGIFSSLDVEENLLLPPVVGRGGMTLHQLYELFPNLYERRHSQGTKLSGGEQQMLAMARILRTGARLLLLDEVTEGLAPVIVKKMGAVIRQLKAAGLTILLVEQNMRFAETVADRHYMVEHGVIVDTYGNGELGTRHETLGSTRLGS